MKLFKNRFFIVAISLLLAAVFIFSGIKLVESQNETIEVARITSMVRRGDIIESDKVDLITIGSYNISDDYVKSVDEVVGKYALADFYPNDFVQKAKINDKLPSAEEKLLQLDGKRLAISVNLKDLSRSLSDKIIAGDIVSCIVTTADEGTKIPVELTYLEVVTTTMPSGTDKTGDGADAENLATATILATPYQACLLSGYDKTAEIHLALVYRGEIETANVFLKKQEEAIKELQNAPTATPSAPENVGKNEGKNNGKNA